MGTSTTGMRYCAPALLTKMSRLDNLLTQAAIEYSDCTSSVNVSMRKITMSYLSRKNGRVVGVDCLVNGMLRDAVKILLRSNTYSIDPHRLGIRRADAKTVTLM